MSFLGGVVDYWKEADAYAFKERELIENRLDDIVPKINESKLKKGLVEKQAGEAVNFFKNRLDGILEGKEADAFLNAVRNNPAKAIKVYQEITAAEKREGYAPVKGDKLIAFYDFIEETKPDDLTRDQWIEKGATIAADPNVQNYDELLVALLGSENIEDVRKLSRQFTEYVVPTTGFEGFDYSALDVLSQSFINQATNNIVEIALAKTRRKYTELTARTEDESNPLSQEEDEFRKDLEDELTMAEKNPLTILTTGYGGEAFKNQADYDIRVSKIPSLKNIFMNHPQYKFYDEDGNYIGIQ
jgi:hypothetical protein